MRHTLAHIWKNAKPIGRASRALANTSDRMRRRFSQKAEMLSTEEMKADAMRST
jgi:hypothetical protein